MSRNTESGRKFSAVPTVADLGSGGRRGKKSIKVGRFRKNDSSCIYGCDTEEVSREVSVHGDVEITPGGESQVLWDET